MAIPHSLEHSAEAGLPATFWQGVSVTEEPGHVQTSGTPHESIFPANAKNLSRTLSSPRAKSLYDSDPRRKRMFLVKHPNRREDSILTSAKFEAIETPGSNSYDRVEGSSTERSVSSTDHNRRWKKRKNSLSKLVNYPTKILGMILPRRSDNPKQSPSVIPPIPPKIVLPSPSLPLRRAETTIRRPKRSCELQTRAHKTGFRQEPESENAYKESIRTAFASLRGPINAAAARARQRFSSADLQGKEKEMGWRRWRVSRIGSLHGSCRSICMIAGTFWIIMLSLVAVCFSVQAVIYTATK
ncbi:hypothetical protein BDP27DRAFT_1371912 [Rhodocollybia butyracea]|uniref:Uncharacterized protein n=1 Tax=Rhodocollybia butyracea TaxID=206335 RepID=A0A9P5P6A3_9AGAR|nr:hypothetical protein BDP27DRAFT_1371912 [Rhodocollybia butyracea]